MSLLVLLLCSLNPHGGYFKSDNYLLQLLRHMTSDVMFLHIFLFIYLFFVQKLQWIKTIALFNKYWSVLKWDLFKKRSFDWNETMSKYVQISIFIGKGLWWRPFKYSCRNEVLQLKRIHHRCYLVKLARLYITFKENCWTIWTTATSSAPLMVPQVQP